MTSEGGQREMTLDEWVGRLLPSHGAVRELEALRARLAALEAGIERLADTFATDRNWNGSVVDELRALLRGDEYEHTNLQE